MSEQFLVYLWSISEGVSIAFCLIGIFGGVISLVVLFASDEKLLPFISTCLCVVSLFLAALIPSKKDIALIWAYPHIKAGITNEKVQAMPNKILDLANGYLDKEIQKIKTEKPAQ